ACRWHGGIAAWPESSDRSSPDEVKRIWHFELAFSETAVEVALLVADGRDDRVTCLRELATFLGLVGFDRGMWVIVGASDELGPAFAPGAVEIPQRRLPFPLAPAGDETHRHPSRFRRIDQIEGRDSRGRHAWEYPCLEAARAAWQPLAGAIRDEAEIVGLEIRPVGQRGFIDIENEGGLADLPSASLDIGARGSENRGDVGIVVL